MANNIKIVGNIINSTSNNSRYLPEDISLIQSTDIIKENFGGPDDYIEYHIYNSDNRLLTPIYSYLDYKLPTSSSLNPGVQYPPNITGNIQTYNVGIESTLTPPTTPLYPVIEIDPIKDLKKYYSTGQFIAKYNIFQNKIGSYTNSKDLFIQEISKDRTEIRVKSVTLGDYEIENKALELINNISNSAYQVSYLLNLGNNEQYVAINVALNKAPDGYEILFKLYQPLPSSVRTKTTLWVVEEKAPSYSFNINLDAIVEPTPPPTLRGPNFDIQIPNQGTISTTYGSYQSLINNLQSLQSSSYHQVLNLMASQSIDINIDYAVTEYNDFGNFTFFGSAYRRITNFYTKVKQIENYNTYINYYTPYVATTASLQTTIDQLKTDISSVISQFDGYETYLYFESGAYAWPKSGSLKPYSLLSTGSAAVLNWYNPMTASAINYDLNNYNNLEYAVPAYLKDDTNNAPFLLFLNMVGHYFDNIWIYLKSVTDLYRANNNLEQGISKDLVYQQLLSLGLHLYNSQAGEDVNQFLIGANTGSSIFDNNYTITGSYLNNVPRKDLVSEIYKRLYHNLPLLVKTKGTVAGLDHLMTVFGIPNKTYYTITSGSIQTTWYTPTGSAATGSILNVKEFGGSLKSRLIDGYNNDKVRIIPNNIVTGESGSVLSPLLSLQTFPTASAQFRENDMHYVDISFSPETQIDTYISGAIVSNNPTWSLDDYIGDPRQLYSSSYIDLDAQRKLYFETGVPGFAPFTASLLDYNGFIRLIEYFDNALFKMLNDFVPERTSLSTGVTINSPVLERNKAVYAVPLVTTQSVHEADYHIAEIKPQYGLFYDELQGDKKPFFDGNISGSTVDIHQYFIDNYNPYLGDWNVWNAQHPPTQSIDSNKFYHSDWNVLLNNVSKSVVSTTRKDIQYIWGTTGSITSSAELQDSYLTLRSYNISRYEGSKLTSKVYNFYTSGSYTGSNGTIQVGDISYGKTAVIDRNSYKLAWVKNIPSQSLNFSEKTTIYLKYLIDSTNQITDLNLYNKNVVEVQNTFKSGTPVIVSLSNVIKPSFQKPLDGSKTIFRGGYSYDPILYREGNESLTFTYSQPVSSYTSYIGVKARSNDFYIYKSPAVLPNSYPFPSTEPPTGAPGSQYAFLINGVPQTANMSYGAYDSTSWFNNHIFPSNLSLSEQKKVEIAVPPSFLGLILRDFANAHVYAFELMPFNDVIYNTESDPSSYIINPSGSLYKVTRSGIYNIKGQIPFSFSGQNFTWFPRVTNNGNISDVGFKAVGIIESSNDITNPNSWKIIGSTTLEPFTSTNNSPAVVTDISRNIIGYKKENDRATHNSTFNKGNFNLKLDLSNVPLNNGDYVRFSFYFIDLANALGYGGLGGCRGFKFMIGGNGVIDGITYTNDKKSYFEIYDTATAYTAYNYTASYNYIQPFFTTGSPSPSNQLIFNNAFNFYTSSIFLPNSTTQNYYTPVIDNFTIQPFDLIRLSPFNDPNPQYYTVVTASLGSRTDVYLTGSFDHTIIMPHSLNSLPQEINTFTYSGNYYTLSQFLPGDVVSITGATINNTGSAVISASLYNPVTNIATLVFTTTVYDSASSFPTFSFVNTTLGSLYVTLDRNITPPAVTNASYFAILRPKPDETSVIVNYKKQPGEVSQTLLIPQDVNAELKDKVGDIFKNFNTDLANQNPQL